MISWIKNNKIEFIIILAILLVAAFFRLYRINEYMTFLGDEGRDALVIKKILVDKDFPLLGPPTSIGNMYLGPLYYYMMAIPMAIFWLNPVAAAVQVALIGTATVGLVYYLSRSWFNKWSAAAAAILYAISPVNIVLTRSSWNPNPAPFFALLTILGLYKIHQTKNFWWFVLTGGALAFAVQMHYLALILVPIIGLLWLYELILRKKSAIPGKNLIIGTTAGIIVFLMLMSPLVIFDYKYNFMNYRAVTTFFTNRETTVNLNIFNTLGRIVPIYNEDLVGRYITSEVAILTPMISILILLPLIFTIYLIISRKKFLWALMALGIWLIIGVLGLALYKQSIYDHYLGFLNPAPFIILGSTIFLVQKLKASKNLMIGLVIIIAIVTLINLLNSPLKRPPNNQLVRTQQVARYIIEKSENEPFNFALIAKSNYDSAYQFYVDQYGRRAEQAPFVITDQLFVVCEDLDCQPVGHPKYEIAAFGWTKIDSITEFAGVKVYRLVHNEEEERLKK